MTLDVLATQLAEYRTAHVTQHEMEQRALKLALVTAQESLREARAVIDGRLAELNNLRNDVVTDRAEFVRQSTHDVEIKAVSEALAELQNWRSKTTGAAVILTVFAGVTGAAISRALGV